MRATLRIVGPVRVALLILAAVLVFAGGASAASGWTEVTIDASDATPLACATITPSGTPPAGGWPGVILFHGLGQTHTDLETYGSALAQFGFAALTCDARGTGDSGGTFGLDGPREVQDAQDLFDWFAARSDVSDTKIGALGLSLGGGVVWNAAAAGVPFKAIIPATTWTSLGAALNPNGVPKTGEIAELGQAVPFSQWDPSLTQALDDLGNGSVTTAVKSVEAARSSRPELHSLKVPTLLLQGRHDFLFDMGQALAAYKLLAGPKRLYLGDIGHAPAGNPTAEQPTYLTEVVRWFDEYLVGGPKVGGGIELAHDPWDGTTTRYKKVPPTRTTSVNLPGSTKLVGTKLAARRSVRLPGGPRETFGDSSLKVHYSGAKSWPDLVATVLVKDKMTPVTEGAAPIRSSSGVVTIPLMNEAVFLPRGKPLVIELAPRSSDNVNNAGISIYEPPVGGAGEIKVGKVTLKLSFLKRAVSK
jgi:dienelactone hydrolase